MHYNDLLHQVRIALEFDHEPNAVEGAMRCLRHAGSLARSFQDSDIAFDDPAIQTNWETLNRIGSFDGIVLERAEFFETLKRFRDQLVVIEAEWLRTWREAEAAAHARGPDLSRATPEELAILEKMSALATVGPDGATDLSAVPTDILEAADTILLRITHQRK